MARHRILQMHSVDPLPRDKTSYVVICVVRSILLMLLTVAAADSNSQNALTLCTGGRGPTGSSSGTGCSAGRIALRGLGTDLPLALLCSFFFFFLGLGGILGTAASSSANEPASGRTTSVPGPFASAAAEGNLRDHGTLSSQVILNQIGTKHAYFL